MYKNTITLLISLLLSVTSFAQTNMDSLYRVHQRQIAELSQSVAQLKEQNTALLQTVSVEQTQLDSLKNQLELTTKNLQTVADSVGIQIKKTNTEIQKTNNVVFEKARAFSKTTLAFVFIVVALIIAIVVAFCLHRKLKKNSQKEISDLKIQTDDEIFKLKAQTDDLNEKIVRQLSSELEELKSISKNIEQVGSLQSAPEPDHSLVKALADRITFMEMTLYKMDKSVKGHKQLSSSIKQMKNNLLANGYEIVDMLGKDYNDGMKVSANFVEDEALEQGKQIISGIIKPQINYQGKMIQSAQITVSQNL